MLPAWIYAFQLGEIFGIVELLKQIVICVEPHEPLEGTNGTLLNVGKVNFLEQKD